MSIEEMNQYWEALTVGELDECRELRAHFHDDVNLLGILDMLDELFELSLDFQSGESEDRSRWAIPGSDRLDADSRGAEDESAKRGDFGKKP